MSACGYDGTATAQKHADGSITWLQLDRQVHVSDEIKDEPLLRSLYEVGGWCSEFNAWHADLIDPHPPITTGATA